MNMRGNMIIIISIIIIRCHLRCASQAGIDHTPWKVFTFFTFIHSKTKNIRHLKGKTAQHSNCLGGSDAFADNCCVGGDNYSRACDNSGDDFDGLIVVLVGVMVIVTRQSWSPRYHLFFGFAFESSQIYSKTTMNSLMVKVIVMIVMVLSMVHLNPPLHCGTARCEIGVHMDHT